MSLDPPNVSLTLPLIRIGTPQRLHMLKIQAAQNKRLSASVMFPKLLEYELRKQGACGLQKLRKCPHLFIRFNIFFTAGPEKSLKTSYLSYRKFRYFTFATPKILEYHPLIM